MSNNKSFFQKLNDSITRFFPFNSTVRDVENDPQIPFDNHLSPIKYPSNRRLASEAFGKDDDLKTKRAKLHHDPLTLPSSRLIRQPIHQSSERNGLISNNSNYAASDISDISVSTSGVSSLHPRAKKQINLNSITDSTAQFSIKYPRNLNLAQKVISPVLNKTTKHSHEFMSSPARKILEKLEKLTTPVTAADRLSALVSRERNASPYCRPTLTNSSRKPIPMKAVTISASTNSIGPIRRKPAATKTKFGYCDQIDLDCENNDSSKVNESTKINLSTIPTHKRSISTNTEESFSNRTQREMSPEMDFTFRSPGTVNDKEYLSPSKTPGKSVQYQFHSVITNKDTKPTTDPKSNNIWKCNTCYIDNIADSDCLHCGNIYKHNTSSIVQLDHVLTRKLNDKTSASIDPQPKIQAPISTPFSTESNLSNPSITSPFNEANKRSSVFNGTSSSNSAEKANGNFGFNLTTVNVASSEIENKTFDVESHAVSKSSLLTFTFDKSQASTSDSLPTISFANTTLPTSSESSKPAFGAITSSTVLLSSPFASITTPISAEKTSTVSSLTFGTTSVAVTSSSPFTFGAKSVPDDSKVDKTLITSLTSIQTISKSSEGIKPSFGASTSTPITFASSMSTSSETNKLEPVTATSTSFSFGLKPSTASSEANKPSTPFSFGAQSVSTSSETKNVQLTEGTSKQFSFGIKPSTASSEANKPSAPFSFGAQSISTSSETNKLESVTATSAQFSFGLKPSTASSETNKLEPVTATSTSFDFGLKPSTVSSEANKSSAPFSFGAQSVSTSSETNNVQPAAATSKQFSFGLKPSTASSEASNSSLFGAVSTSSENNKFQSATVTSSLFGSKPSTTNFDETKSLTGATTSTAFTFGSTSVSGSLGSNNISMFSATTTSAGTFSFNSKAAEPNKTGFGSNVSAPFSANTETNKSDFGVATTSTGQFNFGASKTTLESTSHVSSSLFSSSTQNTQASKPFVQPLATAAPTSVSQSSPFQFGSTSNVSVLNADKSNVTRPSFNSNASDTQPKGFNFIAQPTNPLAQTNSTGFNFGDNAKATEKAPVSLFTANSSSSTNGNLFSANKQLPSVGSATTNVFGQKPPEAVPSSSFNFGSSSNTAAVPSMNFGQPATNSATAFGAVPSSFGSSNSINNTMFGNNMTQPAMSSFTAPMFSSRQPANNDNAFNFSRSTNPTSNIDNVFHFNSQNHYNGTPTANQRKLVKGRRKK